MSLNPEALYPEALYQETQPLESRPMLPLPDNTLNTRYTFSPIYSTGDPGKQSKLIGYRVTTKGTKDNPNGNEFIVKPDSPAFKNLTNQILSNMADSVQAGLPFDIAERAQQALIRLGMEDVPTDPTEILEIVQSAGESLLTIEQTRTKLAEINAQQAFLNLFIESLHMNMAQYLLLPPHVQVGLKATSLATQALILQKLGVNENTAKTAKIIKEITADLSWSARAVALVAHLADQLALESAKIIGLASGAGKKVIEDASSVLPEVGYGVGNGLRGVVDGITTKSPKGRENDSTDVEFTELDDEQPTTYHPVGMNARPGGNQSNYGDPMG